MSTFMERVSRGLVILDGAMGTALQALSLTAEDYGGHDGCAEILNLTRPEVIRDIHSRYLAAGAHGVETNTFGASPPTLAEYGLAGEAERVNRAAVRLAREACDAFSSPERPRFVVGSMGPGTRLPSLEQTSWGEIEQASRLQSRAMLEEGVDALLLETCQDLLQVRAALAGMTEARRETGVEAPVMVQVTIEPSGTMLVGSDLGAVLAVLHSQDVAVIGLNCATGPAEMAPHVGWLSRHCLRHVSVLPNAGIPEQVEERTVFPMGPEPFAEWLERFVVEDGVSVVGGCCGTTPEHIAALARRLDRRVPAPRAPTWQPSLSSLYGAVTLRQEADVLSIGERTNANGSAAFRKRLQVEDWPGITNVGRVQLQEGAHAVDLCTATVGRDEVADMAEVAGRFNTAVRGPVVVDSTSIEALSAALERLAGRSVINSVNLEGGEARAGEVLRLARRHGAAVIALAIDEDGMARTPERKLQISERLFSLAVDRHGLSPADIIFDPLTFTVATGRADDRQAAVATLEAVSLISSRFPSSGVVLGISNVSFGLTPPARRILNSVFLHLARQAGLTAAIINPAGIIPLFGLDPADMEAAEDLLLDRRDRSEDPLAAFMGRFQERPEAEEGPTIRLPVEDRLRKRVVEGDGDGLHGDLEEALQAHRPMAIINDMLLTGMREVGEHFAAGRTQLPFVLQSAEVVKASVDWLKPHLEEEGATSRRGLVLLATVEGDVHDIGKNLAGILLANNGFHVVDLGTRQSADRLVAACHEHAPDAVGLSGLLVRSTVIMKDNLRELRRQGIRVPVVLGGAALTRSYVERECSAAYGQRVAYAKDAFDGLRFMEELEAAREAGVPSRWAISLQSPQPPPARRKGARPPEPPEDTPGTPGRVATIPEPPFMGVRRADPVPLEEVLQFLNLDSLFRFHWGFKSTRKNDPSWDAEVEATLMPLLESWLQRATSEHILRPAAAWGYFHCEAEPDALHIRRPQEGVVSLALEMGRGGPNLASCFRPVGDGPDVVALMVVTMGEAVVDAMAHLFQGGAYRDYLLLYGLAAEATEALAAWMHRQIRRELRIDGEDAATMEGLLRNHHRGRRYSFGYPSLPRMEDQEKLLSLLGAEAIGVSMDREHQLHPEFTTASLVTHHPESRYFKV